MTIIVYFFIISNILLIIHTIWVHFLIYKEKNYLCVYGVSCFSIHNFVVKIYVIIYTNK